MHALMLSKVENSRFANSEDLGLYLVSQSSRLNRAVVGKVHGVEIVVHPNDNLDDVRAQISQKLVGRGYNPAFLA